MNLPLEVKLQLSESKTQYHFKAASNQMVYQMGIASPIEVVSGQPYSGSYEVTPTNELQTLETENRRMMQNIIVNPIPSNYGLITWDGSTLIVS